MTSFAPNIELLFTEAGDAPDRIRAAAAAGFTYVEMWQSSTKDIPAIREALDETGVQIAAQLAEPRIQFMIPPRVDSVFLNGLDASVSDAQALGVPRLVVQSGCGFGGRKRADQLVELAEIYRLGVDHIAGSGIDLVLEPLNIRVDHPGTLLDRTSEALDVVRAVGSDHFGLLYDVYHSAVEGEDTAEVLAGVNTELHYVQLADAPGRGEPGTGSIQFAARLDAVARTGYTGPIGLEYVPTQPTLASLDGLSRATGLDLVGADL